ncbi:hypothetical protein [Virgibacillus sp. JSM 102003]|uniref:hypothetical protein n=1 Tax=Virgibacillus sp. JSM 102003 TaxID=1562108 RepID=UPI0035C24BCA
MNYGSVNLTLERVIKKMMRTSMAILGFYNVLNGKIIFVTPRISNYILNPLVDIIKELNILYKELNLEFEFIHYANEDLTENLVNPVIVESEFVVGTSEIFINNLKMFKLFLNTLITSLKTLNACLSNGNSEERQINSNNHENIDNKHKVAYYLSRFEHDKLFPASNQNQAIVIISKILGIKHSTLRNKRDTFDPFCNKIKSRGPRRKGWWQNDKLPADMERIFNNYLKIEEKEIEKEIRSILKI